jgi:lipid II:glycine glycyltransferase (peptidoglycan interpeptide bridge formation enzyme)
MENLDISKTVDPESWNNDAIRLRGCCFHSYEWSVFSAENNDAVPLYFRLNDNSNNLCSVGFGLLKHKMLAGVPLLRTLSFGSLPAHKDREALSKMINEIIAYCRSKQMACLEIHSFGTPFQTDILQEYGFSVSRRWEFILDIGKSEEDIWNALHSKKRNLIRKAQKAGLRVEKKDTIHNLNEFRNLAFDTWKRKKSQGIEFPAPASETYFRLLKERLVDAGLGRLYLAYQGDQIMAGAFFVGYNNSVYYMLSSSSDQGLKNAAPDLILWNSITDYRKDGYGTFNFGGLSESELNGNPLEESGLYHFKQRFSSEPHACYKGTLILRPAYYKTYDTFKKIKSFISAG